MVKRLPLEQQSWGAAESAALTPTRTVRGKVEQITVKVSTATAGDITFTVAIADEDGAALYSKASIADAGTVIYRANSNKATMDADFNAFLADGILTFTITPSKAPGASGVTVDVAIFVTGSNINW